MRKVHFFVVTAVLLLLLGSCEQLAGLKNKKLDAETLSQTLPGGWRLSQAGADEIWYFSGDRTYVKIKRFEEEYGTWGIQEGNLLMVKQREANPAAYQVLLDGNVLMLGETVSLLRDSMAVQQVEARLTERLVGKWQTMVGEEVYQFMPNGYMLIAYGDEMAEDGSWRLTGNQLMENETSISAAPLSFFGNEMQWSTQRFTRIGDVVAGDIPEGVRSRIVVLGQPIGQHGFAADLGDFGQVTFAPYWEDRFGASRVHYYLLRNGKPVYELPAFTAARGKFDGLQAVAPADVNRDGKTDVVILADYLPENAELDASAASFAGVYLNKGNAFTFDAARSKRANQLGKDKTMEQVLGALQQQPKTAKKPATSTPNLSQYQNDRTICRIRVASLKGTIDLEAIGKIADLGVLSFEPADNGFTRIYLGNYLGKYAAYKVLQQVKRRGYPSAFVVAEYNFLETDEAQASPYSTYQIFASKKLNVTALNELPDKYREQVYIGASGNTYRVSLGIYQKEKFPYEEQTYVGLGASLGYSDGFSKTIK